MNGSVFPCQIFFLLKKELVIVNGLLSAGHCQRHVLSTDTLTLTITDFILGVAVKIEKIKKC